MCVYIMCVCVHSVYVCVLCVCVCVLYVQCIQHDKTPFYSLLYTLAHPPIVHPPTVHPPPTPSGGKTRKTAGPRSEGESYWLLAEAAGWFDSRDVRERTFTEVCMCCACVCILSLCIC